MHNPKFTIYKSVNNAQYYFRLKAGNGEIILSSEGYISKQGCLNGISSVKINSTFDIRYERKNLLNNYRFNLKASNGEIIGKSESYSTNTSRENGISAVKRIAPSALIEDIT